MARNCGIDVEVNLADYEKDILQWVTDNFLPHDVFPESELREWAEDHGMKEPQENGEVDR